jgi:hypothetical protein
MVMLSIQRCGMSLAQQTLSGRNRCGVGLRLDQFGQGVDERLRRGRWHRGGLLEALARGWERRRADSDQNPTARSRSWPRLLSYRLPAAGTLGGMPAAIVGGRRGLVPWWTAALWGLAGAAVVEGLALYQAIHRVKDFPWRKEGEARFPAYLTSVIIRVAVGAGMAAAFGASTQIAGPLGALIVGVTAPKIVEQMLRHGLAHQAAEPAPPSATPAPTTGASVQGGPDAA